MRHQRDLHASSLRNRLLCRSLIIPASSQKCQHSPSAASCPCCQEPPTGKKNRSPVDGLIIAALVISSFLLRYGWLVAVGLAHFRGLSCWPWQPACFSLYQPCDAGVKTTADGSPGLTARQEKSFTILSRILTDFDNANRRCSPPTTKWEESGHESCS